jgi:hypothetical protein
MKVCSHKGFVIAVLTRGEHCPPHVHVGADKWEARFEFSFWHNGVRLIDVVPVQRKPTISLLEGLRQSIKQPTHLRRARECWWISLQSVCMVNQQWDIKAGEVVSVKSAKTRLIQAARFDALAYTTVLQLAGQKGLVEITL